MAKTLSNEAEMYPPVTEWLTSLLKPRHKKAIVHSDDTSGIALYRWLEQNDYQGFFPEYLGYDIRVDVTAIVRTTKSAHLAFVECKKNPITLVDVSQLLGYCRVAQPECAFIVSPEGISEHLSYLLRTYQRYDVLQYHKRRRIKVATWNQERREIAADSLIPPGEFLEFEEQ